VAPFKLVLGVALIAVGVGASMLLLPTEAEPRRLSRNQPVNRSALERLDISANNSPAAARNPTDPANVVVVNRIDRPRFSCALHASFDGARTWQDIPVPFPAGEEEPARCYAPDVAYSPDGKLHLSYVTLKGVGNVPNAAWVVSSSDGGRTLSTPVRAAGPLAFQVQLTADPADPARLQLTWLQASAVGTLLFPSTGNPVVSSTSVDAGMSWSAPVRVSSESRGRVVAPSPAAGPDGKLYVLYLDLLEDRLDYAGAHEGRGGDPYSGAWALVLARSADRGVTWEESVIAADLVPTQRFVVFIPPGPSLAVDAASGRLYASFSDGRLGDADVWLWSSSDGGRTFGPAVRVNDTPDRDGTSQYLPQVDVAPGGRVDVVYLDRRADPANILNEVSLQSSFDQGRTFTRRLALSDQPSDSRVAPGDELGLPDLGSRLGLDSTKDQALAIWPDTRAGTRLTQKQDLASAIVAVPAPSRRWPGWLRLASFGLVGLGAVSLVLGLRRPRAPARGGPVLVDPGPPLPEGPPAPRM